MAVPNQAVTPVRKLHTLHRRKECVSFCFDRLRQQPTGAAPQDGRQRVVDRLGLTQRDNGATACHGVSAPSGVQAGLHPPRYAAFLIQPSPSFPHSSILAAEDRRDAGTWGVHLLDAAEQGLRPDYTIADAGQGLRAGQKAAWGDTPYHGDVFHAQRQARLKQCGSATG
jgi:hypothetical protein